MVKKTRLCTLMAGLAFTIAVGSAAASSYPEKPVHIVIPFPPGGTTDMVGRVFADSFSKALGQTVVVENKGGAGGTIGTRSVAMSAPDGYTLLLGTISTHGTSSAVYKNLSYDPGKDFTPITQISRIPYVLAVNNEFPVQNYGELVELLKKEPGKHSYASSGTGGATHMAVEYYKYMTGLNLSHVPYRGTGPAISDVVAGHVSIILDSISATLPQIQAGHLKPLAVVNSERLPTLPDVPTLAELGLGEYHADVWNGLFAPAGIPDDVLQKLNTAAQEALQNPELKERFAGMDAEVVGGAAESFSAMMDKEIEKWRKVADFAKISLD
ncbi:MAG: tripartite tricarboxylate transporter substrate binding protein [Burkholderiaceae bacterium]